MSDELLELRRRILQMQLAYDDAVGFTEERRERVLKARAAALRQPALAERAPPGVPALMFSLGEESYAIETRFVLEVSPLPAITRVPGVPEFYAGVAHHRGEVVAVVDLHVLLDLALEAVSERTRLLVLGEERPELAVMVDRVDSQVQVHLPSLQDVHGEGASRDYVRGVTEGAVIVLDAAALLADRRLYVEHEGED